MNTSFRRLSPMDWGMLALFAFAMVVMIPFGMVVAGWIDEFILVAGYSTILLIGIAYMLVRIAKMAAIATQQQKARKAQIIAHLTQIEQHMQAALNRAEHTASLFKRRQILAKARDEGLSINPHHELRAALDGRPFTSLLKKVQEALELVDDDLLTERTVLHATCLRLIEAEDWNRAEQALVQLSQYGDNWADNQLPDVRAKAEIKLQSTVIVLHMAEIAKAEELTPTMIEKLGTAAKALQAVSPAHQLATGGLRIYTELQAVFPIYVTMAQAEAAFDWRSAWAAVISIPPEMHSYKAIKTIVLRIAEARGDWLKETWARCGGDGGKWWHALDVLAILIPQATLAEFAKNGAARELLPPTLATIARDLFVQVPPRLAAIHKLTETWQADAVAITKLISADVSEGAADVLRHDAQPYLDLKETWAVLADAAQACLAPKGGDGPTRFVQYLRDLGRYRPEVDPFGEIK